MPKIKSRAPQTSDTKETRLVAAQSFIKGDRVRHKITGKIGVFDSINLGFALPEVWVQFETDTEIKVPISCNPLELELIERCNDSTKFSVAAPELAAGATEELKEQDLSSSSMSPSSLSCIPFEEPSSPDITHTSPVTTTLETSDVSQDSLMLSAEVLHAKELMEPTPMVEESTTLALDSGTNCSELSTSANPDSSSETQAVPPDIQSQDSDTQLLNEFSGVLPSAGSMLNGKLFQEPHSERPTRGNGYSLLPTPMAHSRASEEYRNPGQDKLEQKLREIGAILPGEVSKPEFREWMIGFPEGWTNITQSDGGQLTLPLETSASPNVVSLIEQKESQPLETLADPNNQQSCGDESDISPDCFKPGMRVWSERRITTKGKLEQVIRMTGVVVRTTSRQIVPNQSSNAPIDTLLVEVQWDGVKSTALLSPSELHMESSSDQATADIPALTSQDAVVPEVVEELTQEEAAERHRLEFTVERSFYEAGAGLRILRDKRLYRSTHHTFEEYCRERFGFGRAHSYRLIDAATVVENLCFHETHDDLSPNRRQILPTKLEQVRPLTTLAPDDMRQIWEEAVKQAGGRVPSGRLVKGIVERLKERNTTPPPIPFQEGDVVLIRGLGNPQLRKYDGQWSIVIAVNEYTVTLAVDGKDVPVLPQFLEAVDPKYWAEIKAVQERITRLQLSYELDPMEDAGLLVLRRRTCFTPKQMMWLEWMENSYGIE